MDANQARAASEEAAGPEKDAETFEMQQLRAMEQPKWNEGRLDDLNEKVDSGIKRLDKRLDDERKDLRTGMREGFEKVDKRFEGIDEEFKAVRGEMKEGFNRVDQRFEKVGEEFKTVRQELKSGFDQLNGKMHWFYGSFVVVIAGQLIVIQI